MPDRRVLRTAEATALLLFLLQGLRTLLSSLFGIIYDAVFAETLGVTEVSIVVVCVFAAFLAPFLVPRRREHVALLLTAVTAALARTLLTVNRAECRLWSALLITAAAGAYGSIILRRSPRTFATALGLAFIVGQLLRAGGNTYDISLRAWWLPMQVLLSLATCGTAWLLHTRSGVEAEAVDGGGIGVISGLSLGALLFLETSLLGFPNAVARWTGADYALVTPLLMVATLLALLRSDQWGGLVLVGSTLLVGWMTGHGLHQLILLASMLLAQLLVISSVRTLVQPGDSGFARLSFVLGMTFFLLLNVALAFAFTYPYTIGFFREKGDYIFLLAFVSLLLPVLESISSIQRSSGRDLKAPHWAAAAFVVLLTTVLALPPRMPAPPASTDSLRVGTYNIHYGYDSNWRFSLEEQARTIEESGADIVMLQEVDAGRITSYGVDDALWLARRLGMDQAFGAALEDLSGVALLSRFPITERDVTQLASELEQTAMVHARVRMDGGAPTVGEATLLDAYGTWLGLEPEERGRQLQDALTIIGDAAPAVLGGDFNATPGSATYEAIQAAGFVDPFAVIGPDGPPTSPAIDPMQRIDYVWSRGLDVKDAQVLGSLASDHRMVVVEFARP